MGYTSLDVKVKGHGNTVAGVMAGLNGSTSVVMGEGRFDNTYIERIGGNLSAGMFRLFNPFKSDSTTTKVNCFVSRFEIEDGQRPQQIANLEALQQSVS